MNAVASPISLRRVHLLLAVQSLVVILLSINRLSRLTLGHVADNEFLRWVDLNNMLILPLISVTAFYLLKKQLEYDTVARNRLNHLLVSSAFVIGVYLLGAGYGDHEITNYLHVRFCNSSAAVENILCRIIIFNDDEFSHWVFFAGFVLINGSMMLIQTLFPHHGLKTKWDVSLLVVNGLVIGLAIFANLAFERIGVDLYIVAMLMALALGLLKRYGGQPLLIYYGVGYSFGFVATVIFKAGS
ncbi:MAG TPA: hypothetical protein VGA99_06555 [bacterium]